MRHRKISNLADIIQLVSGTRILYCLLAGWQPERVQSQILSGAAHRQTSRVGMTGMRLPLSGNVIVMY